MWSWCCVARALAPTACPGYSIARMTVRCVVRDRGLLFLLSSSFCVACASSTVPPSAPERTALVAQPCAGLELGSEPIDPAHARVFVELVEVSSRELPEPIGRWLEANPVQMRSSANVIAFPNVPTSTPWGQCVDAVCASMNLTLSLTARLPELASEPIQVALRIDEARGEGTESQPRVLLDTTLSALNQVPVVLPPLSEASAGSIIMTAYLLRRHDDLRRILECKEAGKARAAEAPPG